MISDVQLPTAGVVVQRLHLRSGRHQHVPDELPGDEESVQVLAARSGGKELRLLLFLQPLSRGGEVRDDGVPGWREVHGRSNIIHK